MQRETVRLSARILFWCAAIVAYIAAILPGQAGPTGNDKTDHILAFATLAMLGRLGWSRSRARLIAILLLLFGVVIELSQATPIIHRDADVRDVLADALGILVGLSVGWTLLQLIRHNAPRDRD
jgi:VanZ family protein